MHELATTDPLPVLQLKLPTHIFKAVKRRAEEMDSEEERQVYLEGVLQRREQAEAATWGKGPGE